MKVADGLGLAYQENWHHDRTVGPASDTGVFTHTLPAAEQSAQLDTQASFAL